MTLDLSKLSSDDMMLNEEHVMFLLDKVRAALLVQKYKTIKLEVAESNYQRLCLGLEPTDALESCSEGVYLRTKTQVPFLLGIGNSTVYPTDYYQGLNICLIARERMRFVGHNEFLRNIIYCSINPDGYLYFKSNNPQFKYLASVQFSAVFEDASKAAELSCDTVCEPWDREFALEQPLAQLLIDSLVKEITGAAYRPADTENTANDDLANLAAYLRQNTKGNLKQTIA